MPHNIVWMRHSLRQLMCVSRKRIGQVLFHVAWDAAAQLPVTKQTTVIVGYQNGHSCQSYNIQQLLLVIKMGAVARHKTDNSYCGLSKCTVARHKTNNNYCPQAVKMSTVASHKTNKQQLLWAMKMGTVTSHKTNNSCCGLSEWAQLPVTKQTNNSYCGLPNCQNSLTQ